MEKMPLFLALKTILLSHKKPNITAGHQEFMFIITGNSIYFTNILSVIHTYVKESALRKKSKSKSPKYICIIVRKFTKSILWFFRKQEL